jgi:ferrochelatase
MAVDGMNNTKRYGVLLANLGTPEAPTKQAVKQFLGEFLHDKRVVDLTRWLWCPILHGVILPIRSPKVAKLYESIWMEEGSPLMVYSKRQRQKLQQALSMPVELGMTYGSPSIADAMSSLQTQGVNHVIVLPLYPQHSASTSAAVYDAISRYLKQERVIPSLSFISEYHDHPLYIDALAASIERHWQENGKGDYLLCSYHGIPQRFVNAGDIYTQHCEETTRLLGEKLGLNSSQIGMSYQSRFGREEWVKPYTDETLKSLPKQGTRSLDIISPAFSVDCLETLEEIKEQCQEIFKEAGGEKYAFIPCLNDDEKHIKMMINLVEREISA